MEPEQSRSGDIDCWLGEICEGLVECDQCKLSGLHGLIRKLYLPKTNIPKPYTRARLRDLQLTAPVYMRIRPYLEKLWDNVNEGQGLYLWSPTTGNGKTTIACIAAIRYLGFSVDEEPFETSGRRVYFLNTPEFLESLRKSFNSPDADLDRLLSELKDPRLAPKVLVMDDIGAENPSQWVIERLYSLINFRVSNGLTTIYTSNISLDEIESRLGPRVRSRIEGSTIEIKFIGKDMRRR